MNYHKVFKLDKSGKSDAFFFKKPGQLIFKKKYLTFLIERFKKEKKDIRICVHKNKSDKLQVMVNLIVKKKQYEIHYHKYSDEYYFPIKGSLKLLKFNQKGKLQSKIVIGKDNIIGRVNKKERHVTIPTSSYCVYLEFRSGSFISHKNIFLNKFVNSRDY